GQLLEQNSEWIPGNFESIDRRSNDLRHEFRVGVRRGLSEFRDNVLWKYPQLLKIAKQAARKMNLTSRSTNHPTNKETMNNANTKAVFDGFLDSERKFPDRLALDVENVEYSYRDLADFAKRIAATLQQNGNQNCQSFTGILAYRTVDAFGGLLGALLAGSAYVPLNRTFPDERLRSTLQRSGCSAIIVDRESEHKLDTLIEDVDRSLTLIFTGRDNCEDLRVKWAKHTVVGMKDLADAADWVEPKVCEDDLAYMLFTSGSTGTPKGVMVSHRNVSAFVDTMVKRYGITEEDKFSQMFEMTFDPSVFDMFVAWEKGAAVCCPSQKTLMKPGKFIQERQLTVWFSVPSTINFMKRFRMLKPGNYPTLRYAHFCGEPLPIESVKAFGEAAPNAVMENLYGPTEMTVTCMMYRWDSKITEGESENGITPIGYPYPGMKLKVVDPDLNEVRIGETGELIMSGPQVALGYYNDPERTAKAFVIPPGETDIYYRTGDRVRRADVGQPVNHFGRIDQQIKVGGHRVELGEIEAVVRNETGAEGVVALGWPMRPNGADGIEVFVESEIEASADLHCRISNRLPEYMVPKRWHFRDNLPLNASGKYDRKKLTEELVAMSS
ncbi:MAG: amino acid adenylation domain-containing protein, partial [Verrucomicrobiota bacterium]